MEGQDLEVSIKHLSCTHNVTQMLLLGWRGIERTSCIWVSVAAWIGHSLIHITFPRHFWLASSTFRPSFATSCLMFIFYTSVSCRLNLDEVWIRTSIRRSHSTSRLLIATFSLMFPYTSPKVWIDGTLSKWKDWPGWLLTWFSAWILLSRAFQALYLHSARCHGQMLGILHSLLMDDQITWE